MSANRETPDSRPETHSAAEPAAELYPGHAAELARRAERAAQLAAAAAVPLPGPLRDVFGHVPETIAGLTVRPLVHYDFVLLAKLDSPLLKHLRKQTSDPSDPSARSDTACDDEQGYEIVFLFTRPVREAAALLARGPREFRAQAIETIGMSLAPVTVGRLIQAVQREFVRAFSTVVGHEQPPPEGEVFTPPPAGRTTASAGGSTTSVNWSTRIRNFLATLLCSIWPAPKAGPGSPGPSSISPGPASNGAPTATSPRNVDNNSGLN